MRMFARAVLAGTAAIAVFAAAAPAVVPSAVPVPSPLPSASPANGAPSSTLQAPDYRLETDTIVSERNGAFTMPHKVAFSRPGSDGTADGAKGNYKKNTVTLTGNVVVHDNGNAPEAETSDEYAKGGPSTLTCDTLDVDAKARTYVATGHVHFTQGSRDAVADAGTLDRGTGMLHLEGRVKMKDGDSSMTAGTMDYNLNSKLVDARGKPIVIKQPIPPPEPSSSSPTPKPKKRRLPF